MATGLSLSSLCSLRASLRLDLRLATLADAAGPGGRGPFHLPLATQVGLELGKDAEHLGKGLAGGDRIVHRLPGDLQRDAPDAQLVPEILQGNPDRSHAGVQSGCSLRACPCRTRAGAPCP